MTAAEKVSTELGTAAACRAFGVARASLYRRRQRGAAPGAERARPRSPRALNAAERQAVLDLLHSERFLDQAPAQVCAALLDKGRYLSARYAPCTGFWMRIRKCANDATNGAIPSTGSRNC